MKATHKKALLSKMEAIIGNSCYNGNIQNWGANYARYCDGREFRYPITFVDDDQSKDKRYQSDPKMSHAHMRTGYYAFGANQLHIIDALEKIIDYLEVHHELKGGSTKK